MRYSQSFLKTQKEAPKEATLVSHQLLERAGYIDQLGAGIYTLMPLGFRVRDKIQTIIRQELNAIGVEDMSMPVVHPAGPWKESGRFFEDIAPLWKIKNKSDEDFVLALTGEEIVTEAAKRVINSYKDLPKLVGQIQTKIRDEVRARGGLLRLREFLMQDAYSFDRDEEGLEASYQRFIGAYEKIFARIGIEVVIIESLAGAMGGTGAHEFMVLTESGEDKIIKTKDGHFLNAEVIYGEDVSKDMDEQAIRAGATDIEVAEILRGIEVGNIFKLGTKYSKPMKLLYKDQDNNNQPVIMGSYGIGLDRTLAAVIEASHDDAGIIWPEAISPYKIYLANLDEDSREAADKLYDELTTLGLEVFYDDRETSIGNKFADADLLGFPYRLSVSKKTLADAKAELKKRTEKESSLIALGQVAASFNA
jgi:prolyl-tRNA synthetase